MCRSRFNVHSHSIQAITKIIFLINVFFELLFVQGLVWQHGDLPLNTLVAGGDSKFYPRKGSRVNLYFCNRNCEA
jgi:hypothetical protein